MKYIIYILLYFYLVTGFMIGFRMPFRYKAGRVLAGILYAFIWLPDLIAAVANDIMRR